MMDRRLTFGHGSRAAVSSHSRQLLVSLRTTSFPPLRLTGDETLE
ncbi:MULTISPECIES: hypothetical protein [Moorena]|nr:MULTISPECIES: hypothetical protein [Moorena]